MQTTKPDFFIVGAPKCGTTAMSDYLGLHPEIYMAQKEMHHFGQDLQFEKNFYRRNLQNYLAKFEPKPGAKRIGEASVWYLYSHQAAHELHDFSPEASIIIMLREPTELIRSLYNFFRADQNEHLPTLNEAWEAQALRNTGKGFSRLSYFKAGLIYQNVVKFTEQIERYINIFGKERVKIIIFDDLKKDTRAVYNDVITFLGCTQWMPQEFPIINASPGLKSPWIQKLIRDPRIRGNLINLRPIIPNSVFTTLQRIENAIASKNTKPQKAPVWDPQLRVQLKKQFTPEVEKLSHLLQRDLSHWNKLD